MISRERRGKAPPDLPEHLDYHSGVPQVLSLMTPPNHQIRASISRYKIQMDLVLFAGVRVSEVVVINIETRVNLDARSSNDRTPTVKAIFPCSPAPSRSAPDTMLQTAMCQSHARRLAGSIVHRM